MPAEAQPSSSTTSGFSIGTFLNRCLKTIFFLAPLSYFCGRAYDDGILTGFGVRQGVAPLSWDDYVFSGVMAFVSVTLRVLEALVDLSVWPPILYTVAAIAIVASVVGTLGRYRHLPQRIRRWPRRLFVWLSDRSPEFYLSLAPIAVLSMLSGLGMTLMVVTFYVVLPAHIAEMAGYADAAKKLKEVRGGDAQMKYPSALVKKPDGSTAPMWVMAVRGEWFVVFDGDRCKLEHKSVIQEIGSAEQLAGMKVAASKQPTKPNRRAAPPARAFD